MAIRLKGDNTRFLFILFLEAVWGLQQVFSAVFGLFAIAKVVSSYEKCQQSMELLLYQSKAKFNEENFQILNLIQNQPSFKVIFFQIDKDIKKNKVGKFEGTTRSIEKALVRSDNKKLDDKKDEDAQRKRQLAMQEKTLDRIDDLQRSIKKLQNERAAMAQMQQMQQFAPAEQYQ